MGANLSSDFGPPEATIGESISYLERGGIKVETMSPLYRSPAFPAGSGPDFVNGAALCRSELSASGVMKLLHQVEATFGRQRETRWGARTLDIDLIGVGDLILPDRATHDRWRALSVEQQQDQTPDHLIVPHPRVQDRAFVLIPLRDVAPDWIHPVLGLNVAQMCDRLPKSEFGGIVPL